MRLELGIGEHQHIQCDFDFLVLNYCLVTESVTEGDIVRPKISSSVPARKMY